MFPSNSNGSNNDPISYIDQSIFQRSFINDINSNSKQEDPPFFHLPSPFFPYELELEDQVVYHPQQQHDILLHHQQPLKADNMTVINMAADHSIKNDIIGLTKDYNNTTEQIPRKRSSKRDRHSKINTAQGLRDRRMRLSLDVAREFFQLQDMLGYDKASKTVEWLLKQSKPEIKKLARDLPQIMNYSSSVGAKSASSTSECEVVSGVDEASIKRSISKGKPSIKEKKTKQSRKSAFHPLAKDLREKARARARERTRKKMMWGKTFDESKIYIDARNHELSQLDSCSPFETGEESGTQSHNMNPSMEVAVAEVEEPSSHGREILDMDEEVIMEKWSPSIFNYLHNTGIPQEHPFADFQIFGGKPWEVYNNQNLC